jgi:CRP-like cAMP-binding protein
MKTRFVLRGEKFFPPHSSFTPSTMSNLPRIKLDIFRNVMEARKYQPGEVIFYQGEVGEEMFAIKKGKVELRFDNRLLDTLEENEVFGEMALVDRLTRSATAVAVDEVEVIAIDEHRFLFMVQQTPNFALTMLKVMALRLRRRETLAPWGKSDSGS